MSEIKLTELQKKIIHGKVCQYCRIETRLQSGKWGSYYICPKCGAYVGCHKGTNNSLGRTANKRLRKLKMSAHEAFDSFWKSKKMKRGAAYSWLANMLELPKEYTHIGMFSESTCLKVIKICQREYNK